MTRNRKLLYCECFKLNSYFPSKGHLDDSHRRVFIKENVITVYRVSRSLNARLRMKRDKEAKVFSLILAYFIIRL